MDSRINIMSNHGGEAVVPQQIFPILQAIAEAEKEFSENERQ
jgi:hypothetical protein